MISFLKIKPIVIALLLVISAQESWAQYISAAQQQKEQIQPEGNQTLSLAYSNLFYMKNYEYFNHIQEGYTYFGTWQRPELCYQPNDWLQLSVGFLAQHDFGEKKFSRLLPVYALQIQKNNFRFRFGTLEGNLNHGLIEPLMSYDKIIERPIEEGVQFLYKSKHFNTDLWLDWQVLQQKGDDFPEEFTGGAALKYTITKPEKSWQISVPLQFVLPHRGGQMDNNISEVSTVIDGAIGLNASWHNPKPLQFIQQVKADVYYANYFHSEKAKSPYPFNRGNGIMANAVIQSRWGLSLVGTYWKGHQFINPRGAPIYGSLTVVDKWPRYWEAERELLFVNLVYEKEILPNLFLDARMSPYYDFKNNLLEYSFQVLASYRNVFSLFKFKQHQNK